MLYVIGKVSGKVYAKGENPAQIARWRQEEQAGVVRIIQQPDDWAEVGDVCVNDIVTKGQPLQVEPAYGPLP